MELCMNHLMSLVEIFSNPKYLWAIASFLVFVMVVISVIRIHLSSSKFDLVQLFAFDQSTGKLSDSKVRLNIAFIISCWAFVYLVMDGKFTEWYFFGFMGAWVTDRIFSRKAKEEPTQLPESDDKQ